MSGEAAYIFGAEKSVELRIARALAYPQFYHSHIPLFQKF